MAVFKTKKTARSKEITLQYLEFIDRHIDEVITGHVPGFMKLHQVAAALYVSHKHLTDSVQKETGHHPCYFYDEKIIEKAKYLLKTTHSSVAQIALLLTYDPSNFSKFFKKWTGSTPKQWRGKI
ncbi:DNA-binding protein [Niabella ginsenosidivorans]|uniref:DNA-binding protein n=1 Tax=Niabella ginsenosidivorans TaxID=1176587 RepID=A0A1A9HX88_9BACT|nr:AraC family transcriptional regulator [Niabella ginsenosidivorans]ANH79853.1 DNA-binding protein [Niabella ginsenosidivorans]